MLSAQEAKHVTQEFKRTKEYYVELFYITTFSMIYRVAQEGLSKIVVPLPHEDHIGHVVSYKDIIDKFLELGYSVKPVNSTSVQLSWY
jgi:hypothetical protein